MSTRINTNVTALQAASNLNSSGNALSQNIQRLSSGLRINSASDDPAGLAISQNFKAQISGVTQAVSNSNDAINEIKTAEGALNQVQTLLVTIRQLAVHASNLGVNSTVDVQADQTQINTAIASINRIAATTSFGNKKLLDGSASDATTSARGTVSSVGLNLVASGSFNAASAGLYNTASVVAATAATDVFALSGGTLSAGSSGTYSGSIVISGVRYNIGTAAANLTDVNSIISSSGYQATIDNTGELEFASQATGQLGTRATFDLSNLEIGSNTAVDLTSGAAVAVGTATATLSGGTATLDTTLGNNTIATGGALVYSINGGATQTFSVTAGQSLSTVNSQLSSSGVNLTVTPNSLLVTGPAISISSFTGKVASSTLNAIGTQLAGADHNATITPSGLGKLDTVAANNTFSQAGSLVFTDNGGAANTVSVTAGESWATFSADVTTADAGAAVAINGSGQLILSGGGAGHDMVVTATTTATLGDVGVSEAAITNGAPVTRGTITFSGGTAPLDTTLANNTIASSGALVYTLNGGSAQTLSLTAGQALDTVNTELGNAGLTLSATSSALKLSGDGRISVTSFTSKVASTTPNTIGAAFAGADHNVTVTPGGLGRLDLVAANNTISQAGSLVFTDNAGAANTVSVSAGETWANFQAGVLAQDAGAVAASINGSGQLVLTGGGAGHDIVITSSTASFGDVGTNENTITAADGSTTSYVFTQSGNTTLSSSGARFAGAITVSGYGAPTTVLTLSAGTSLSTLNSSLSAIGVTASVDPSGDLLFTGTHALVTPSITLGAGFSVYDALTPSTGSVANGSDATLILSNATSTLTSVSMQRSSDAGYFRFANGLVVSSTVTSGSFTAQVNAASGTSSRGQALQFQLGADEGQTASFDIGSTAADQLGEGASPYLDAAGATQTVTTSSVDDINVMTFQGAQDALAVIDKAIDEISTLRANLGSFQTNVLQSNVISLSVAQQNLSASLSTIQDTDLSTEIVEYTKNQILVQAGTSALGQANQAPQSILKLLQ